MNPDVIAQLVREALLMAILVSAPLVGVAALVGLLFGVLQALTQLQDQTTTFAVKMMAVFGVLLVVTPWMSTLIGRFGERIFEMLLDVK